MYYADNRSYDPDEAARHYIRGCNGVPDQLPENFITIDSFEVQEFLTWKCKPIYKKDQLNNEMIWQIGFDGLYLWTLYGRTTSPAISTSRVELDSRSTDLVVESLEKASNLHLLKIRDGYLGLDDDDKPFRKGMKGHPYKEGCIKIWPVILDVKCNGLRCLSSRRELDEDISMVSYGNTSLDHITHLRHGISMLLSLLPQGTVIDGELYNHSMPLCDINSAVRSNVNISTSVRRICYYIFDIFYPANPPVEERYKTLVNAFNLYISRATKDGSGSSNYIRVLPKWYAYSHKDVLLGMDFAIERGFEGVVIRQSSINRKPGSQAWKRTMYVFGRTVALYKLKKYHSCEGIVVGIAETKGQEKNMCKLRVELKNGYTTSVRFGSAEEKIRWRNDPSSILGKILELEYNEVHPVSGIPQCAQGKVLRDRYSL